MDVPQYAMNIRSMIQETRGKFFSVDFRKRTNGEMRHMGCRTGVGKGVQGIGHKFSPKDKGLIQVWDTAKRQHRFVPEEGVTRFKCGQKVWP